LRARLSSLSDPLGIALRRVRASVSSPSVLRAMTVAVLALGGYLRLNRYIDNRSLFLDEAYIASSVLSRDIVDLAKPLDYDQVAPFGWLALVKLATELFGISEPALRLVPLLSGLVSLALFYPLARRFLSHRGALIACTLMAATDPAIHWSVMVKPYSTDLLLAIAFLLLATRVNWQRLSPGSTAYLAGLGALALWFSNSAAFVLAAVGVYGLVSSGVDRSRGKRVHVAAIGAVWIISFGALYFASLHAAIQNEFLRDYWRQRLVQLPTFDAERIAAQLALLQGVFNDPVGLPPETGGALVFLIGLAVYLMATPLEGGLLLAPVAIAYLASAAGIYPFWGRLLLFTVPSFHILIAAGVEQIFHGVRRLGWIAVAGLMLVLLFVPLRLGISRGVNPRPLEEMRPVTAYVLREYERGDAIYVYYGAEPAWKYYLKLFGATDIHYVEGIKAREDPQKYNEEISQFEGQKRVWLVFSHVHQGGLGSEESLILRRARCLGTEIDIHEDFGAHAYLFDMTRPSTECESR